MRIWLIFFSGIHADDLIPSYFYTCFGGKLSDSGDKRIIYLFILNLKLNFDVFIKFTIVYLISYLYFKGRSIAIAAIIIPLGLFIYLIDGNFFLSKAAVCFLTNNIISYTTLFLKLNFVE